MTNKFVYRILFPSEFKGQIDFISGTIDLSALKNYGFFTIPIRFKLFNPNYSIYFWFEVSNLLHVLERFYGVHPETKSDFIINIDPENNRYELCLYRQGLREPVIIPEYAYQLIVFKNKFEHFRSENYNQPRGAWVW